MIVAQKTSEKVEGLRHHNPVEEELGSDSAAHIPDNIGETETLEG